MPKSLGLALFALRFTPYALRLELYALSFKLHHAL